MRRTIRPARLRLLRAIPLFKGCSDKELATVARLVTEVEVPQGKILTREGAPGRESFIIVAGEASVTTGGLEVASLGPGDFFGELALLQSSHVRNATVTALTPMRLLVSDPAEFDSLLQLGNAATSMLKEVVDRMAKTMVAKPA